MRKIKKLKRAVDVYFADPELGEEIYGHINDWDVSDFTNMSELFAGMDFGPRINLKDWDVSNVTDASYMFQKAEVSSAGDAGISNWVFPNLKNAEYMFNEAQFDHLDLNNWKPLGVKYYGMFEDFCIQLFTPEQTILPNMSKWELNYFCKQAEAPHLMFGGEFYGFQKKHLDIVSKWNWVKELSVEKLFFSN
jgi:hypothetical protein